MILLKNGIIYDGSTNPPYKADLLIDNDEIIDVSKVGIEKKDAEVYDCSNLCISPGFIDAHSHNDFFTIKENNLKYFKDFIRQGVTTMVTGNCGFSIAGYKEGTPYLNEIGGGLFEGSPKDFGSFKKWGETIDGKCPVNILSLVGHGTIRISLNSKNSNKLNERQMEDLEYIVDKSLSEGAAGVSFGLMYEPGRFAPSDEIIKIAKVVKRHNKIVSFHARAYSRVSTSYAPPIGGRAHGLRAIDEVLCIARQTGVKTQLSHLIFVGKNSWNYVDEALSLMENAVKDGIDIMFDTYSTDFGASIISVVLPPWYLALSKNNKQKPLVKFRLFLEIMMAKKFLGFDFNDILISNTAGKCKEIEGKTISELAKLWKINEFSAYMKANEKTDSKAEVLMFKYSNEKILEKLRNHPLALYMSDAWVNDYGIQNYAIYYNFPKFILLAKNCSTPIEQAINKMAYLTASRYNIKSRGLIKKGFKADLVVFNFDKLSYKEKSAESPKGFVHVFINGKHVLKDGVLNEEIAAKSGRFIQ